MSDKNHKAVFLGRLWKLHKASNGVWETIDKQTGIVRIHRVSIESVKAPDGYRAISVVVGPWRMVWGKLVQHNKNETKFASDLDLAQEIERKK